MPAPSAASAGRQEYFRKVHAIQSSRGCDFATAKQLYRQNGAAQSQATMSINEIVALASAKVDEIHSELERLSGRISELQNELTSWGKVRDSVTDAPQHVLAES